tara:strand:+ start:1410 stop:1844 length:435 start_codon:yes stop_codon:yes gene_type:complete
MRRITKNKMDEALSTIGETTTLMNTPEQERQFGIEGTFNIYSIGMKDNYDLPDLEMRGIPGMLISAAAQTINEINAYRLISDEPVLANQIIGWQHGEIKVVQGDDWDGAIPHKAEDMLRLTSAVTTIDHEDCECCQFGNAGITE